MEITDALIDRFFKGACSSEEAAAVLWYLESNPEAKEQYLGKQEWDEAFASETRMSPVQSARMLGHIQSSLFSKSPKRFLSPYIAVAASLIVIAAGYLFWFGSKVSPVEIAGVMPQETWKVISNTGQGVKRFSLEDGSYVALDPNSEISVPIRFRKNSREVRLEGSAIFSVSEDKNKPFVVFANNTSTTALGTKFSISARKGLQTTAITLLEGKVLVKVANKKTKAVMHYYLRPGAELVYHKETGMILIQSVAQSSKRASKMRGKHLRINARPQGPLISFEREPVSAVFLALELAFDKKISFPDTGLDDHYFTGSFHADDSLDRILQVVSETNNLELKKTRSGYQIRTSTNKFHQ